MSGCTDRGLREVEKVLENNGIEVERISSPVFSAVCWG